MQALGFHQRSSRQYMSKLAEGVTAALTERDRPFGDYRVTEEDAGRMS
jgi:enoyl-CoA hydratase